MIAANDNPRDIRRRLRRRIAECRSAVVELRDEAASDPLRADELLPLAAETETITDEAERLLHE